MDINSQYLPSRAKSLLQGQHKVSTYESTGGAVTAQFASHNLTLIPAIPANSTVHDNTSGAGTVARLILASDTHSSEVQIHATDIDQVFLDVLSADVAAHSWPVSVSNQRSEALSFSDETFDYSITNIGIFFTSSAGLDGAKEIYRTLKPGGTAVVNCWDSVTWFFPIKLVHDAMRPGKPYPAPVINWSDGQQIQKVVAEAGFAKEGLRVEQSEAFARVPEAEFRGWVEKTWAYLAGIGLWQESDEERWDEAVDLLVKLLKEQPGTKVVDGVVQMRASQWVVVATK
ncbi:S-adenosyl-L-methionine-dependent methyltransferase [Polyplosphaeria fusca]|uniref:S-adenosyl-L-methionine-dependent methyltransferase n=1 Tax=Polyplosphaeria fusca TaxID=682080 RepID=A0A9P4QYW6_9PLEO|nr:S-adenosyl-L-methionine-dependent methyltransferase [Polyplosphaeria fusca]